MLLNLRRYNSLHERRAYQRLFPWRLPWRGEAITGEATPHLLCSFSAPYFLAQEYPDLRIIALLRNPIDKISSMYHFRKTTAFEPSRRETAAASIEEVLAREKQLMERGVPLMFVAQIDMLARYYFPEQTKDLGGCYHPYLSICLYEYWLKRYFSLFPRKQILVLQSEKLFTDPHRQLKRVYDFLGCDFTPEHNANHFVQTHKNVYPSVRMSGETRAFLAEYFKAPNQSLYELLGEEYDWH